MSDRPAWTPAKIAVLLLMHEDGATQRAIGEAIGMSPGAVCKYRQFLGLEVVRKPKKPADTVSGAIHPDTRQKMVGAHQVFKWGRDNGVKSYNLRACNVLRRELKLPTFFVLPSRLRIG